MPFQQLRRILVETGVGIVEDEVEHRLRVVAADFQIVLLGNQAACRALVARPVVERIHGQDIGQQFRRGIRIFRVARDHRLQDHRLGVVAIRRQRLVEMAQRGVEIKLPAIEAGELIERRRRATPDSRWLCKTTDRPPRTRP